MLRLNSLLYGEEPVIKNLVQHGSLRLLGVLGRSRRQRERRLGYILEFSGNPIVHSYTWFVALAYTDAEDVRRKQLLFLYNDENIRLARAGIGVEKDGIQAFDYWIGYRDKNQHRNEEGASGSVAIHTAGGWRDGL